MNQKYFSSLFHTIGGRYFRDTKVVGIDFFSSIINDDDPSSILVHETVHTFLCNNTEMGIFLTDVENNIQKFSNLTKDDQKKIVQLIFSSQQAVQEGYATYLQYAMIKKRLSGKKQKEWLKSLPDKYRRWVRPFLFSLKLLDEDREKINQVILYAMNTHIREDAEKYKLLDSFSNIENYMMNINNNPNERAKRILKTVKKDPSLLKLKLDKIPTLSGVTHFEPITNKAIVSFIKYLSNQAGEEINLTEDQIADAPSVDDILNHVQNNMIVANLNLNLAETASILPKISDVIHFSDIIETTLIMSLDEKSKDLINTMKDQYDYEPEVSLIMQTKTGEKYIYVTSFTVATGLLNTHLKSAVLAVKFAEYDVVQNKIHCIPKCRPPNLVIFNHYWQIKKLFTRYIEKYGKIFIEHCHIGFEGTPFRIFIANIAGTTPLLTLNVLIGKQISQILDLIKPYTHEGTYEFMSKFKRQVNSHFIFWSGWDHRIDWASTLQRI